uniref:Transposase Tc1-like domain-containing protein n=1 Tax=Salarias fasciatus TaxID=181472 RepID=A0A672JJ44_SALFA
MESLNSEEKKLESLHFESKIRAHPSAVAKIWTKYKQHGKVVKVKRTGRPRKTFQRQDKQLKEEAGVNVCDRTVQNGLKEGFSYRKAKRKPSLMLQQKRTRLQWAKERQSWAVDDWMKCFFFIFF